MAFERRMSPNILATAYGSNSSSASKKVMKSARGSGDWVTHLRAPLFRASPAYMVRDVQKIWMLSRARWSGHRLALTADTSTMTDAILARVWVCTLFRQRPRYGM